MRGSRHLDYPYWGLGSWEDSGCDPSHSPEVASRPGGERKAVSSSQQGEDLKGVQGRPASCICFRWGYEAAGIGPSRVSSLLSPSNPHRSHHPR
ncbi:hypothetical protein MC885_020244 [Smutsia gigantea]|nr:hypothetical protein MC885_020244 [Smutsia gigantea]